MDNGIVRVYYYLAHVQVDVLILIVVDNGIVLSHQRKLQQLHQRLNPYCSGQWYRTY